MYFALGVTAQGCGIKSLQWGFRREAIASVDVIRQPELFAILQCSNSGVVVHFVFLFFCFFFSHLFFRLELCLSNTQYPILVRVCDLSYQIQF